MFFGRMYRIGWMEELLYMRRKTASCDKIVLIDFVGDTHKSLHHPVNPGYPVEKKK